MTDRTGQELDDYQLLRLLGQGTFGEVYLAEQIHTHTQVAVKVLTTSFSQEAQQQAAILADFLQEARTLFRLKHPAIVPLLDFGLEQTTPFLVMEYAPNGTLRDQHRPGERVSLEIVNTYVQQVAAALQYAHEQRLIHRDVKPQNMLVSQQGQILLSDFGIAAVAHSERSLKTQEMTGTVPYMAPEQIQGKPRPASDQYALAICVYEWLCGQRPFAGSTWELIGQHLSAEPPALRSHIAGLPAPVEEVVLHALAKDPQQRFASVAAFATAFQQASQPAIVRPIELTSVPEQVHPASPPLFEVPALTAQPEGDRPLASPMPSASTVPVSPAPVAGSAVLESMRPGAIPLAPLPTSQPEPSTLSEAKRTMPTLLNTLPESPLNASSMTTPFTEQPRIFVAENPTTLPPLPVAIPLPGRSSNNHHWWSAGRISLLAAVLVLVISGLFISALVRGHTPTSTASTLTTANAHDTQTSVNTANANATAQAQTNANATATATSPSTITEFPLPTSPGPAEGITTGPDGNLWFLEGDANRIGRITPMGTITEFSVPSAPNGYTGTGEITAGPDGNLWFTEFLSNKIGRITLGGTITEFLLTSSGQGPNGITVGPDGNLWFTNGGRGIIGRLTPDGQFTNFHVNSDLGGITKGPDGNLWFTEGVNQIGRITPNGTITEFPLPTNDYPGAITVGPDGNLWFTGEGKIGRITPTGKITEFPVPIANSGWSLPTAGITKGPDGNLWFTERGVNQIGRITPTGKITEFPVPNTGANDPEDITVGPDGNLWFTDGGKIGRITIGK